MRPYVKNLHIRRRYLNDLNNNRNIHNISLELLVSAYLIHNIINIISNLE